MFRSLDHLGFDRLVYPYQYNEHLSVAMASLIVPIRVGTQCSVVESSMVESYLDD